jgi:hypothetical protein
VLPGILGYVLNVLLLTVERRMLASRGAPPAGLTHELME